jgi:hypothetical protein
MNKNCNKTTDQSEKNIKIKFCLKIMNFKVIKINKPFQIEKK